MSVYIKRIKKTKKTIDSIYTHAFINQLLMWDKKRSYFSLSYPSILEPTWDSVYMYVCVCGGGGGGGYTLYSAFTQFTETGHRLI